MEKSLKAVLFSRPIEFRRTHDLTELAQLPRDHGIEAPVSDDPLRRLNPFAVILRYDDVEVEFIVSEDVANWVLDVRHWAEEQVNAAMKDEENEG